MGATMPESPQRRIVLSDYDPAWPEMFETERARLQKAIGEWTAAVEHVGSTSIPGIAAKPIIDIGVALRSYVDALYCITPLIELGYECLGEFGIPGRIYFRKRTDSPVPGQSPSHSVGRTHQIHMYEHGHSEHIQHILFRDWLRAHPDDAREYEALKHKLAAEHDDVEAYAEAKSDFVQRILRAAKERAAGPVVIADYNPDWPAMYDRERQRIMDAAGDCVIDIQHVGSTSVPGLAAKPVIDIMPGVRNLEDVQHIIEPLKRLGYECVPADVDDIPERRYFRRGFPRSHHLHVVETTSEFWRRHLAFRDYLRAHPGAAREYETLKRRLATQYGDDRLGYVNAKTEFILGIEEKAALATSPSSLSAQRGTPNQQ
jgi:GrpB-like predicted nucleotidyltransferase (UPF0157 family)